MTTVEFLSHLRQLGLRLWLDGGQLRYQAPKGVITADLLAQLRLHKAEIIALIQQTGQTTPPGLSLRPAPRHQPVPLSLAQQRLWFLEQLHGPSPAYNIAGAFLLNGRLHLPALQQSLDEIVNRHESLRTTFHHDPTAETPIQHIHPPAPVPLPVHDLGHVPQEEWLAEARRWANQEAARPFDITTGPLFRAHLLKTADFQHLLLLTFHHLITDGQSIEIFNRELAALYTAFAAGNPSPLPQLAHQYADFATSQHRWLTENLLAGQLAYWQKQLADAPDLLQLPLDFPRPARQTFAGAVQTAVFAPPLVQTLRQLAQSEGATLYMVVQAALSAFLARYGRQDDLLTGLSVANRHPDTADLIGFFVNTLVIRANLAGGNTFRQLLQQIRVTTLDAFSQQELPFEKLVEVMRPQRDMSHTPLVQVMVSWLDGEQGIPRLPGLTITPFPTDFVPARFDLSLEVYETSQELQLVWIYNTALFNPETITRLAANFEQFVTAVSATPDAPVDQLPIVSPAELQHLAAFNDTKRPYPTDICLHQLFEQQVEQRGGETAVKFRQHTLTYAQLNERANQLAHYLQNQGVRPETMVGVCMERSMEMVVALYAILKAGGAYVPLDPSYPPERLRFMLADAQPPLLLTQHHLLPLLPHTETKVIPLDTAPWLADSPIHNPTSPVTPTNLAYMIYTSGSTGQPKGAMNSHAGIVNRLLWMQEQYQLKADDRILQKTPFSFDVSVWEFFWPLLAGACLIVAEPEGHRDGRYLAHTIQTEGITTLHFVPSMLSLFLQEATASQCSSLKRVICSGEALPYPLQEQFFDILPTTELHNLYGPTETAVDVTHWHCIPNDPRGYVPIGRPIANTQLYIVDPHNQPVPIGVPGELLIGGVQVGRGYWRREELTAEKFVSTQYSVLSIQYSVVSSQYSVKEQLGTDNWSLGTVYRTGDLCRWRADGTVEYLGRLDFQVKLRGLRIELGEIETALMAHSAVSQAVVLLRHDLPGGPQLVAYLTAEPGLDITALRARLQQTLPDYMVPAHIMHLPALPLSPNGKLDRRQLPLPALPTVTGGSRRTPIEASLVDIWAQLLGLPTVGITDNFFDLGGHSLLAMQVISRVGAIYGRSFPVRALFEAPTITQFGRYIEEALHTERPFLPPPTPATRPPLLPLSYAQHRLWILSQLPGQEAAYNIPFALHIRGTLDIPALQRSLQQLVERHESLRTGFVAINGRPYQQIHPPITIPLPVLDMRGQPKQVAEQVAEEGKRPFSLTHPPLLRLTLLQLDDTEHLLLLTMHHIISDGWSLSIFARELSQLYQGETLPALPLHYADYALWQQQHLTDELLSPQTAYWQQQLQGLPPLLNLPTDRPRPAIQTANGRIHYFTFDPALTAALKQCARQNHTTLYMTLLAGFAALLSRISRQEDVAIGSGIANRGYAELESLIGFFVNTLVMRVDTSHNPTFAALLAQVRHTTLDAYAHQDVPFERLVDLLQPERNMSHAPLFQVIFTLQNMPAAEATLPGLTITPWPIQQTVSKVDITVLMAETADSLTGSLEYNHDLFDATTIERLVGQFQTLLHHAVVHPERPIQHLPLLSPAEQEQLLVQWNNTQSNYPRHQTIPALFEAQVAQTPAETAVLFANQTLTYAQLNQRANQLAHYLRHLGVRPGDRVGIALPRSLELVVGLLAILKVGAAYVPLDADYPPERLTFMLADTAVSALLTYSSWQLPHPNQICLDTNWQTIAQWPDHNPNMAITAESLAYIMYTSGSTGQPKGVAILHRAIVRLVRETNFAHLTAAETFLLLAPISFDASTLEIWGALLNGAKLAIAPPHKLSLAELAATIRDNKVTILWLTAGLFTLMVEQQLNDLGGVRQLLAGGDVLPVPQVKKVLENLPNCQLINGYGPTENTTFTCCYPITPASLLEPSIPIGRPIPNSQIYILDEHLQPAPIGVWGDLYTAGDGLAHSYWGQPGLTAEKFIPHPFSATPGARLYQTGDVARYLPDGNVQFWGRLDNQVKIRGFRIELGEVELAIRQNPAVKTCVVVAQPGTTAADKRLVAYVVAAETAVSPPDLRPFLQTKLPDYMIPSHFVWLPELPLTPNGKVDRRALPAPDTFTAAPQALPTTENEKRLADLWQTVLGVPQVGLHDDFFALGGHSLLATQLIARIPDLFMVELPLAAIFESPTVAGLLEQIETLQWASNAPDDNTLAVDEYGRL